MSQKARSSRGLKTPQILTIPLAEIDDTPCRDRRGYARDGDLPLGGMEESILVSGQTGLVLVKPRKGKKGKWVLLDGLRVVQALKENGADNVLALVADRDPHRQTLQVVHRHCVRSHTPSAWARMLAQWKASYEVAFPKATRHGGKRSNQDRTDADLCFTQMAAAELGKSVSTIERWVRLASAAPEVLRDFDKGDLTLSEAVSLVGKSKAAHEKLVRKKGQAKAEAAEAEADARDEAAETNPGRFLENLRAIPDAVFRYYPTVPRGRVEELVDALLALVTEAQ